MIRRFFIALGLIPLLTAASPSPEVVITEAYRFGADPARLYTLAVRTGQGKTTDLKLAPPAELGVRSLDWSSHLSGDSRGLVELTGPKAIWSAQKTLPGTNMDFMAAEIKRRDTAWPAVAPGPISFELLTFSAIYPPPQDDQSFADHADVVDWAANWSTGAPSYGKLMRQALAMVMKAPLQPIPFGLKPETIAVDHAFITEAPDRQGRMVIAVARMDNDADRAEKAFWTEAVFAMMADKESHLRVIPIIPAFGTDSGNDRFRREYRIVDLIDRKGNGNLDILLSVSDEKARHLELFEWDGKTYNLIASSPHNGVPKTLDDG